MAKKSICTVCGLETAGEFQFCSACGGATNIVEEAANTAPDFGAPIQQDLNAGYVPPVQDYSVQQPAQPAGRKGLAIAGMIVGIASLVFSCFGIFGIIAGIVGLILSILGLKSSKRGMALAGVICSAIALLLCIIVTAVLGSAVMEVLNSAGDLSYYY